MNRQDEMDDPNSGLNSAADDEPIFVIRASDPAAAESLRCWIDERVRRGLNGYEDAKIRDALYLLSLMCAYHRDALARRSRPVDK